MVHLVLPKITIRIKISFIIDRPHLGRGSNDFYPNLLSIPVNELENDQSDNSILVHSG